MSFLIETHKYIMSIIENLDVVLRANISGFQKNMKKATAGVTKLKDKVASSGKKMLSAMKNGLVMGAKLGAMAIIALGAAAATAVVGLVALSWKTFQLTDQTSKLSRELGVSQKSLVSWGHLANLTSTNGAAALNKGLQKLSRNMGDILNGNKTKIISDSIKALGYEAESFAKLSLDEQFEKIADGLHGMENASKRASVANALLGKSGQGLTDMLSSNGSAGLKEAQKDAERLGLIVSDQTAAAVEKANDSWYRFKQSITGVGVSFSKILAPAISWVSDRITNLIVAGRQWIESWQPMVQNGIKSLDQFKPHLIAIRSVFVTVFKGIYSVASTVFKTIYNVAASAFSAIAGGIVELAASFGIATNSWTEFKDQMLNGLIAVEFTVQNWQSVWSAMVTSAALQITRFSDITSHIFTVTIPTVFEEFGNFSGKFFDNLASNISNAWQAIVAMFKGEDFSMTWEPLSEGFAKSMAKISTSMIVPESDVAKLLKAQLQQESFAIAKTYDAYSKKRFTELKNTTGSLFSMPDFKLPSFGGAIGNDDIGAGSSVKAGAYAKGSQAAFDIINQKEQTEELKLQKQQLEATENVKTLLSDIFQLWQNGTTLVAANL